MPVDGKSSSGVRWRRRRPEPSARIPLLAQNVRRRGLQCDFRLQAARFEQLPPARRLLLAAPFVEQLGGPPGSRRTESSGARLARGCGLSAKPPNRSRRYFARSPDRRVVSPVLGLSRQARRPGPARDRRPRRTLQAGRRDRRSGGACGHRPRAPARSRSTSRSRKSRAASIRSGETISSPRPAISTARSRQIPAGRRPPEVGLGDWPRLLPAYPLHPG